ncbi:MAG: metallophosphoesterase, partial [Clostridia bacterium]|nr:metallophosphoesterase [Clostridia bacterium]
MKKRTLSFIMACLMVVSTFIISRPLVEVHAIEYNEDENQWTLPMNWAVGLEVDEATGWDLVKQGPWKLSFFENPDDSSTIQENVANINASDVKQSNSSGIGPIPYIESNNNRITTVPNVTYWDEWYVNPARRWKGGSVFYRGDNETYMGISPMNTTTVLDGVTYVSNNATVVFTVPEGKGGVYSYTELVTGLKFADADGVEISVTATVRKNGTVVDSFTPTSDNPTKNLMGKAVLEEGDLLMFTFTLTTLDATVTTAKDPVIKLGKTVVRRISEDTKVYDLPTDFATSTVNGAWEVGGLDMTTGTEYTLVAPDEKDVPTSWSRNIANADGTARGGLASFIYVNGVMGVNPGGGSSQRSELATTATFTAPEDGLYSYVEIANSQGASLANDGSRAVSFFVMKDGVILDISTPALREATVSNFNGYVALKKGEKLVFGAVRYVYYLSGNADWTQGADAWIGATIKKLSVSKVGDLPNQTYNKYTFTTDLTSISSGPFTMGAYDLKNKTPLTTEIKTLTKYASTETYQAVVATTFNTTPLFDLRSSPIQWGPDGGTLATMKERVLCPAVIFTAPNSGTFSLGAVTTKNYAYYGGASRHADYLVLRSDGTVIYDGSTVNAYTGGTYGWTSLIGGSFYLEEGEQVYIIKAHDEDITATNVNTGIIHRLEVAEVYGHECDSSFLEKIDEVAPPSYLLTGTKAHYRCIDCGRIWADSEATIPTTKEELVIEPNIEFTEPEKTGLGFYMTRRYKAEKALAAAPMTIEAWIKLPTDAPDDAYAGTYKAVYSDYQDNSHPYVSLLIVEDGAPRLQWQQAYSNRDSITFTDVDVRTGEWVHLVVTRDFEANTGSCYINGELVQTVDFANGYGVVETAVNPMCVGGSNSGSNTQFFKQGLIHSVAAYSDIRTAAEIEGNYANGVTDGGSDLLSYYIVSPEGNERLCDYSSYQNHLTMTNQAGTTVEEKYIPVATVQKLGTEFGWNDIYIEDEIVEKYPRSVKATVYFPDLYPDSMRGGNIYNSYIGKAPSFGVEIYSNGAPRLYIQNEAGTVKDIVFSSLNVYNGEKTTFEIVIEDDAVKLYVDGILKESKTSAGIGAFVDAIKPTRKMLVGGDYRERNTQYFKGQLIDLEIGGVGKYDFTEAGETVTDLSGNGNDLKHTGHFIDYEIPSDFAYSLLLLGDTQYVNDRHPENFIKIYDWIVGNVDAHKIKYVMGLGDVTEASGEAEWLRAKQQFARLDGIVPYSIIKGNHDTSVTLNATFNTPEYNATFEGKYGDGIENTYRCITIGKVNYLIMTLDYGPTDDVLEWANEVVAAHPHHNVIVTTHAYLKADGTYLTAADKWAASGSDPITGGWKAYDYYPEANDGDEIWEKFISKHENISFVVSGHISSTNVVITEATGDNGNVVKQMLVDPQGVDASLYGGTGMVTLLYFNEDGSECEIRTYSTIHDGEHYEELSYNSAVNTVECECKGGEATCVSGAICEICGKEYTEKNPENHGEISYEANGDRTHKVLCSLGCVIDENATCVLDENDACTDCEHSYKVEI